MDYSKPAIRSEHALTRPLSNFARQSFCWLAIGLFGLFGTPNLLSAELPVPSARVSEYELKAAFLYNFARFVEWPESRRTRDELVIGILGDDPFGDVIDAVARGRQIKGRSITVMRIEGDDEIGHCDVLFISRSEKRRFGEITSRLDGDPVLTVGDSPSFLANGGMINLELNGPNVTFNVNLSAANRSELSISSKLLSLAQSVKRGGR